MSENTIGSRCEKLAGFFNTAPMKKTFGMELRFEPDGTAVFEMPFSGTFAVTDLPIETDYLSR